MNVKINSESTESQQKVVSFADQNAQWVYSVDNRLDDVHKTVDSNDADLNTFFSRPIKIESFTWTVGSTFGLTTNPWQKYFEDLRVINRICNYNVLRAKLCVRIMINGNGFHYGRALASYRPLHNEDTMVAWRYGLVPQDTIAASQRMHVWIDPTKSQGGTLCLPYVFYKNAMNIPEQDWREMGELDIASVTTLKHANGGTDAVTISVFAWAEDVALSVPTIAEPGALAPQSVLEEHANEADEMSKGPISGPAAVISKIAGSLSKIPQIAPMALATQMAADATGNIAKLFGFSKPVDTGPIQSYKPTYAGNMVNSNVLDTSTKLTYDVKQELTIDPVATGLGPDDEMAITSIAKRESYLTQFSWATTDAAETLLWNCYVEPMLYDTAAPSGFTEYHYTPMAYASLPFENWRGTIKYRFQVVASAYHKGRLKVVYEPYFGGANSEYNTQYTHVIDLANERDFTVEIDWGQEFSYLDHRDLGVVGAPFDTIALGGALHGQANGILGVYVVNDLTTPSATLGDVSILVSVSAGDDYEVINPSNNLQNVTFWQPQSVLEEQAFLEEHAEALDQADADRTTAESAPVSEVANKEMAIALNMDDNAHKIYYGDPVTSIRQVLKRYYPYRAWTSQSATAYTYHSINLPDFPVYRGYDTGLITFDNSSAPVNPTPYNYVFTTPLNWFTPAFLCRRGGLRWKYVYSGPTDKVQLMSVARHAEPVGFSRAELPVLDVTSRSEATAAANEAMIDTSAGMQVTQIQANPVLEVEIPFHTNYRFIPARTKNFNESVDPFNKFHQLKFPNYWDSPEALRSEARVYAFCSAGEDFSLSFFQAAPVFWSAVDPAPSTTN
jgi:hypothetical protein